MWLTWFSSQLVVSAVQRKSQINIYFLIFLKLVCFCVLCSRWPVSQSTRSVLNACFFFWQPLVAECVDRDSVLQRVLIFSIRDKALMAGNIKQALLRMPQAACCYCLDLAMHWSLSSVVFIDHPGPKYLHAKILFQQLHISNLCNCFSWHLVLCKLHLTNN